MESNLALALRVLRRRVRRTELSSDPPEDWIRSAPAKSGAEDAVAHVDGATGAPRRSRKARDEFENENKLVEDTAMNHVSRLLGPLTQR